MLGMRYEAKGRQSNYLNTNYYKETRSRRNRTTTGWIYMIKRANYCAFF